jgi:hypothetical protein
VQVLLYGMAMGVLEQGMLFLYIIDELHGSTTLCGCAQRLLNTLHL